MFKSETIIYWSKEDAAFIAEVPEFERASAHLRLAPEPGLARSDT